MSLVDEEAANKALEEVYKCTYEGERVAEILAGARLLEAYQQAKLDKVEERLGAECQFNKTLKKAALLERPLPKLPEKKPIANAYYQPSLVSQNDLNQIIDYLTALEKQRG